MSDTVTASEMYSLVQDLFPLHRSMTGEGVRATFKLLQSWLPLSIHEVPTGTQVFDWSIPKEWTIRDAFIANDAGERLVDYGKSNLHVMNNSVPIDACMPWHDLASHVYSLPDRKDAIPYRTAFFRDDWGFCVPHTLRNTLADSNEDLHVRIDSNHHEGSLSYAECTLPGETDRSVLIHCHTCHPSLANDNLSGLAVATFLARSLSQKPHRLTYRFVFAPATIGAIAWLAINETTIPPLIDHGLVLSLLGNEGSFTYKRSRQTDADIDRIASQAVSARGGTIRDFRPFGYDERQFCSPGFDLPVGCLSRTPHGEFPEYHTSGDNLDFVNGARLCESLRLCEEIVDAIETQHAHSTPTSPTNNSARARKRNSGEDIFPLNRHPKCEPCLGKYDLYRGFGQTDDRGDFQQAVMWVLNLSDGCHSIDDIAEKSRLNRREIRKAISALEEVDLLTTLDFEGDHEMKINE